MLRIVSCSGGKDSTATLLLALERHPKEEVRAAFADVGNEHRLTYEYLDYLRDRLQIDIHVVKADLTDAMAKRRAQLQDIIDGGPDYAPRAKFPWTPESAARALAVMHPTGNPYLDRCVLAGRFPSRKTQFCTKELKVFPMEAYQLGLLADAGAIESWQGVRAEESPARALLPERDDNGGFGISVYRPILTWTVEQVFAQHRKHNVEPNPLYKLGMGRVGCMPCINARKAEVLEISKRFPEELERIAEWERIVSRASRTGTSNFFPTGYEKDGVTLVPNKIEHVVQWARTTRGRKNFDWLSDDEPALCSSHYGLCE